MESTTVAKTQFQKHRKKVAKRFATLMQQCRELYYYGCEVDAWMPEIILLPYVSIHWKHDPTWYRIIAPPGSGKSSHLKLLEGYELTHVIDEFTPKSFVSGFRGVNNEDPSKLLQYNGKVLIVSDESTLMEQRLEDRNTVQSILRRVYDGTMNKDFGNLKETQRYKSHFNLLIGSTPTVDRYFTYQQSLGERYITYRAQIPDKKMLTRKAFENQFVRHNDRVEELQKKFTEFLRRLPEADITEVEIGFEMQELLIECANLVATLRTHVNRNSTGRDITTIPQSESAGRLVHQMTQLAVSDAIVRGDNALTMEHLKKAIYIGLGCLSAVTIFMLYHMWQFTNEPGRKGEALWFSVQDMVMRTALGRSTVAQIMEDMAVHRVLDIRTGRKQGGRLIEYRINGEMEELFKTLRFFKHYKPPVKEILEMSKNSTKKKTKSSKFISVPDSKNEKSNERKNA
jgi:hypothetical protein